MNVLSLFDGAAMGFQAAKKIGLNIENYYSSEVDKYAIKIAENNHNIIKLGDINKWKEWKIDFRKIDLIIGGSPCQGLSVAGLGYGLLDERSKLFYIFNDIKNHVLYHNPKCLFLLENVVPKEKEDIQTITKFIGVEPVFINSDLFVQQNRPRLYWFNWNMDTIPSRPKWDGNFYQWRRTYFRKNKNGVCPCLTANMGAGGHNVPLKSMDLKDKLTPEDCEVLQGLPIGYTKGVSNSQRYKMIGNGWTVDVIAHILSFIP